MKKTYPARLILNGILVAALTFCLGLGAWGCAAACSNSHIDTVDEAQPDQTLQIFATSSLKKALPKVIRLYTKQHKDKEAADIHFDDSEALLSQIDAGSTPDIFISASSAAMDRAEQNELINASTRVGMFTTELVIVAKKGSKLRIDSLKDIADIVKSGKKIALGDAADVLAGKYANQALARIGLYSNAAGIDGQYARSINGSVILGDTVKTVATCVRSASAAIGFMRWCDLFRFKGLKAVFTTPATSHKAIRYSGAICQGASHADAAGDFLMFCLSDRKAKKIWTQYGFKLVTNSRVTSLQSSKSQS